VDFKTYSELRSSNAFIRREDVEDIIETSDARILNLLAGDLRTGRMNYVSLELSGKAAAKVLETSEDPWTRGAAYGFLIDNEMLYGRPYRGLFEEALKEGIVPEFPLYRNSRDRELITGYRTYADTLDGLVESMKDASKERIVLDDPTPLDRALTMLEGQDTIDQLKGICKLYRFYAGEGSDRRMTAMLERARQDTRTLLEGLSGDEMENLHDATESLTGEEEHFWLLHAAMNGSYYHAEEELRWRIPNIDDDRRDDYIDALKAVIERGVMA
jgi:hypothetical protein